MIAREVIITKGKFKGVKGYSFDKLFNLKNPTIHIFDENNEYIVGYDEVKHTGKFIELKENKQ